MNEPNESEQDLSALVDNGDDIDDGDVESDENPEFDDVADTDQVDRSDCKLGNEQQNTEESNPEAPKPGQ